MQVDFDYRQSGFEETQWHKI